MPGQGCPNQHVRRVIFAATFFFLVSGFCPLGPRLLCAQSWSGQYQPNQPSAQTSVDLPIQYQPVQHFPVGQAPQQTWQQPVPIAQAQPVVPNQTPPLLMLPVQVAQGQVTHGIVQAEPAFDNRASNIATEPFVHGLCRVNISWGGGTPLIWQGGISLSDGEMRHLTLLGSEPDVPGSVWLEGNELGIRSRMPKTYSGVHVTLNCSPNALLQIQLFDRDQKANITTTVPVAELLKGPVQQPLDEAGNRIRIERVPGDELSIDMTQPRQAQTVFGPGETLSFEVLPRYLSHAKEKKHFLNVSVFRSRSNNRVFEQEWPVIDETIPETPTIVPVSLALPQEEGVFDIVLTLYGKSDRFGLFGGKDKVLVQRTFQCLVMSPAPPAASSIDAQAIQQGNFRGMLVEHIDPANPNWWRRFTKSPILPRIGSLGAAPTNAQSPTTPYEPFPEPQEDRSTLENVRERVSQLAPGQLLGRNSEPTLWQENFGSGHITPYNSEKYGTHGFVEMLPSRDAKSPSWEAYAVPINEPGKAHYLEIDYLSGIPQTLGISIVEPTVSGGLFPLTVDSGLHVMRELVTDNLDGRTMQHRVLFWPKTKTPIIVMTNQSADHSAVYGGIRVYRAPDVFPQSPRSASGTDAAIGHKQYRLFAGYLHRPNFCDNFSATRVPGHIPNVGVTDWETFYQGMTRLVQYMRMVGYGGMMVSTVSDGSSLYPSEKLSPTPRYDSGAFLANGEDPVRKDVLHALATTFDRENLTLIPAVDFCMPLPALEQQLRREGNDPSHATGIAIIGPYGTPLSDHYLGQNQSGRAPYYNLLNPDVQTAMLDVVRELVEKTASHPSFGGIAVQLSPEGYAMLPEEYWGLDDDTIRRFSRDTRIEVPGTGANRFMTRAEFLRSQCLEQWLKWRADQVSDFYRRMAEMIVNVRPDAKLYLAGAKMFDSPLCQRLFVPSLPQSGSVYQAMAYHGFDASAYQNNPDIVFMRPEKIVPDNRLADTAMGIELSHADTGMFFQQTQGTDKGFASLFYHQPIERTLSEFDAKSPFQPAASWFSIEAVPAAEQNRMRFVRHLARHDVTGFFDGGIMLPLGEEETIRDFITQYQMLPRTTFQTYGNIGTRSIQPVTMRYVNTDRGTYCYVVNDTAFSVSVNAMFEARQGTKLVSLSTQRELASPRTIENGFEWSQTLQPYDFIAFVISDVRCRPANVDVSFPTNIVGGSGHLDRQLKRLNDRIRHTRNWLEWNKLPNANFEMTSTQWEHYLADQGNNAAQERPRALTALPRPQLGNLFSGRNATDAIDEMQNQSGEKPQQYGSLIPGWQIESPPTFQAAVDTQISHEGTTSLRLTAQQSGGRLVSMPFEAPQTGRLFVSFWVGISENAAQLPLKLAVTGQYDSRPLLRSATVGPEIWQTISQTSPVNGVRWHPVVVPFRDLPLTGIDSLAVEFEMYDAGTIWVDDLRLYHLAFTEDERTLLQRMAHVVDYRLGEGRVSDALNILDGYWPQLLAECLPNIDEIVAKETAAAATNAASAPPPPPPVQEEPKKKTIGDRIKGLKWW